MVRLGPIYIGVCFKCRRLKFMRQRHQGTTYVNDADNFVISCTSCFAEIEEYWADMWSDYWSGCLGLPTWKDI